MLLSLLIVTTLLSGQIKKHLALEGGLGFGQVIGSAYKSGLVLSTSLHYKMKSFDFELKDELGLISPGQSYPRIDEATITSSPYSFLILKVRTQNDPYPKYKSLQLWLNYSPDFPNFKPIFGIGHGYSRLGEIKRTTYDVDLNKSYSHSSVKIDHSFYYKLGYKIKDFRFYFIWSRDKRRRSVDSGQFLLTYNFDFHKKSPPPKDAYWITTKPYHKKVYFRVEVGLNRIIPISGRYPGMAGAYIWDVNFLIDKGRNLFLGAIGVFKKSRETIRSYDKVEILQNEDKTGLDIFTSSLASKTYSYRLYLQQQKVYSRNVDFIYGAGLGWYGVEKIRINPTTYVGPAKRIGVFGFAGFRTGPFTNKIGMNIPFGRISMYFTYRLGIGLNIKKTVKPEDE